jgi:hypothetical protein
LEEPFFGDDDDDDDTLAEEDCPVADDFFEHTDSSLSSPNSLFREVDAASSIDASSSSSSQSSSRLSSAFPLLIYCSFLKTTSPLLIFDSVFSFISVICLDCNMMVVGSSSFTTAEVVGLCSSSMFV